MQICSNPYVSPKKNAAKTTQKPIITMELGFGFSTLNAPGRNRTTNMPTTSAGEPTRIASVSLLRRIVSSVRRVSTRHCVTPFATGRLCTRSLASAGLRSGREWHGVGAASRSVSASRQ